MSGYNDPKFLAYIELENKKKLYEKFIEDEKRQNEENSAVAELQNYLPPEIPTPHQFSPRPSMVTQHQYSPPRPSMVTQHQYSPPRPSMAIIPQAYQIQTQQPNMPYQILTAPAPSTPNIHQQLTSTLTSNDIIQEAISEISAPPMVNLEQLQGDQRKGKNIESLYKYHNKARINLDVEDEDDEEEEDCFEIDKEDKKDDCNFVEQKILLINSKTGEVDNETIIKTQNRQKNMEYRIKEKGTHEMMMMVGYLLTQKFKKKKRVNRECRYLNSLLRRIYKQYDEKNKEKRSKK